MVMKKGSSRPKKEDFKNPDNNRVLNFRYDNRGEKEIFPANKLVSSYVFNESEEDEASLAHFMGVVAEKNGMDRNSIQHLLPAVLRMLKSNIEWADNPHKEKEGLKATKNSPTCKQCGNEYPHLLKGGTWYCDECGKTF